MPSDGPADPAYGESAPEELAWSYISSLAGLRHQRDIRPRYVSHNGGGGGVTMVVARDALTKYYVLPLYISA